jgi:hypothetical protein
LKDSVKYNILEISLLISAFLNLPSMVVSVLSDYDSPWHYSLVVTTIITIIIGSFYIKYADKTLSET